MLSVIILGKVESGLKSTFTCLLNIESFDHAGKTMLLRTSTSRPQAGQEMIKLHLEFIKAGLEDHKACISQFVNLTNPVKFGEVS